MDILRLNTLTRADVEAIFERVDGREAPDERLTGTVGWSFEGNGVRTRAAFMQAFRDLNLLFTDLPNLLKTRERVEDLAGYLDPFFSLFVIREADHDRLEAFARASARPVINAMSSVEHPCEVLTDAYYIDRRIKPLSAARIALWGPTTNVFRSWHALARILDLSLIQICPGRDHDRPPWVRVVERPPEDIDIVITDAFPETAGPGVRPLTLEDLSRMGHPALLPTPPFSFSAGGELKLDPTRYPRFVGYQQKTLLVPVHQAIIRQVCAAHY